MIQKLKQFSVMIAASVGAFILLFIMAALTGLLIKFLFLAFMLGYDLI